MPDVRVLLLEPDALQRRAIARALGDHFDVTQAPDAIRALELILDSRRFDVMVASVDAPLLEGLALIDRLRKDRNALAGRCVVVSSDPDGMRGQLRDRALEVLQGPVRIETLVEVVKRTADRS